MTIRHHSVPCYVRTAGLDKLERVARELEEHISVLVDYDVIDYQVGDMLTEYVWRITNKYNDENQSELATVHNLGERNGSIALGQDRPEHNGSSS